jgi:phosphoserine phosphatase
MSVIMSCIVTLVAARAATTLSPATIARVREAVRGGEPTLLSPGEAADIPCETAPAMADLTACLDGAAIDVFILPAEGRRKSLLLADMDSTIVTTETLDEIAAFAGLKDRIAAITARAMNGEIDFKEALRLRVGMLKGLPLAALERTWDATQLTPGAQTLVRTMKAHGATTALVSGGFTFFTSRVAALCGFDLHRSNVLEDDGAALTGTVADPILDRDAKLEELKRLAVLQGLPLDATMAIGDGANDLPMIKAAGLGIAFHAKPVVAAEARHQIVYGDLRAALFSQGYKSASFAE